METAQPAAAALVCGGRCSRPCWGELASTCSLLDACDLKRLCVLDRSAACRTAVCSNMLWLALMVGVYVVTLVVSTRWAASPSSFLSLEKWRRFLLRVVPLAALSAILVCFLVVQGYIVRDPATLAAPTHSGLRLDVPVAGRRRAIFDCPSIGTELDILLLRLQEIGDVVDHVFVVESPRDFANNPKPMYLAENMHVVQHWVDKGKLTRVQYNPPPEYADMSPMQRQRSQRSRVLDALAQTRPQSDDIVVMADVDEIPSASALVSARDAVPNADFPISLSMHIVSYDFGCVMDWAWQKPKLVLWRQLTKTCRSSWWELLTATTTCPDQVCAHVMYSCRRNANARTTLQLRDRISWRWQTRRFAPAIMLVDGGWHLTSFMSQDAIIKKLRSSVHPERVKFANIPGTIPCLIARCHGLFTGDYGARRDPTTVLLPGNSSRDPTYARFMRSPSDFRDVLAQPEVASLGPTCGAPEYMFPSGIMHWPFPLLVAIAFCYSLLHHVLFMVVFCVVKVLIAINGWRNSPPRPHGE